MHKILSFINIFIICTVFSLHIIIFMLLYDISKFSLKEYFHIQFIQLNLKHKNKNLIFLTNSST